MSRKLVFLVSILFYSPAHAAIQTAAASNQFVDCGNKANLYSAGSFSIVVWINVTTFANATNSVFSDTEDGGVCNNSSFNLRVLSNGQVSFLWEEPSGTFPAALTPSGTIATGRAYNIVCTWDGVKRSVYVDGVISTQNYTAQGRSDVSGGSTNFGRPGGCTITTLDFDGIIYEGGFYAYALNAAEVASIGKNRQSGPFGSPVSYWRLNEGTVNTVAGGGATVIDIAGGGNNCTPGASPTWRGSVLSIP